MDLVYIVKEDDINPDLRYSLRSVAKHVPHDKIWIVGYKPTWVQNVEYLPVAQTGNKWNNSVKNILAACNCPDISEDFVLMNDDFFAIKPIDNLEKSINVTLGRLAVSINKYKSYKSRWGRAFGYLNELLHELKCKKIYYDYESHIPLMINKTKYLEIMNLPKVKEFMKTPKVLHKRSLYKNMTESTNPRIITADVKINYDSDVPKKIKICDWLSVFDDQVGNPGFRRLNYFLQQLFPEKCIYEKNNYKPVHVEPVELTKVTRKVIINPDGSRKLVKQII